jgi:hypothetical protein
VHGFTKLSLIFLGLLSLNSFARIDNVEGDGRFYSKDEDTLSFIKKQLLSEAFKDIYTKELKEMGLDPEKFWRGFEEKFSEYYLPIKETLEKKYGLDQEKVKNKAKVAFRKEERLKRLALRSRYGRLNRAIPQYSIKKMSRSPQVPNSRYIRISAKVSRKELHRIYLSFTADNSDRHFSTLYLTPRYKLIDSSWNDTGVEVETDFTEVLNNSWKEKIEANIGKKISRIVFTDVALEDELLKFSRLNLEARNNLSEEKPEDAATESNDFSNSLWMRMNFTLKKSKEEEELKRREFEISGDLLLQDLASHDIVAFKDFSEQKKAYSYEENKALSSALANAVYQMPLASFKELETKLVSRRLGLKQVTLEVRNYGNIRELNSLTKIIGERGITKQFSPTLESFSANNAKILLEYAGEDEEMINILKSLANVPVANNKVITFAGTDQVFQLNLSGPNGQNERGSEEVEGNIPQEGSGDQKAKETKSAS